MEKKIVLQDRDDNMVLGVLYSKIDDVQKVRDDLFEARENWLDADDDVFLMDFLGNQLDKEKYRLVTENINVIKI